MHSVPTFPDYFPYQSLRLKEVGGVAYAVYKTKQEDNVRVGVVIIDAGKEKATQKSWQYIVSRCRRHLHRPCDVNHK